MMHRFHVALLLFAAAQSPLAQAQDPAEIVEEYFCDVAGLKPVETGACTIVCEAIEQVAVIPTGICVPAMEKGWEYLEAKCPKTLNKKNTTLQVNGDPSPLDIVMKLLCELAKNDSAKEVAIDQACNFLKQYIQFEPPQACELVLEEAWETLEEKCPKGHVALEAEEGTLVV